MFKEFKIDHELVTYLIENNLNPNAEEWSKKTFFHEYCKNYLDHRTIEGLN